MFVPTQSQFKTLTDRKINWAFTLTTGNHPKNGLMCCQMMHLPTQTVLATGYGREDLEAFEEAFKVLPDVNPSMVSSGDPNALAEANAEIASLKAQLETATAPKTSKGSKKTEPEAVPA